MNDSSLTPPSTRHLSRIHSLVVLARVHTQDRVQYMLDLEIRVCVVPFLASW